MSTTITIRMTIGAQTHELNLVGDPADALFSVQVGRTVSEILLGHRDEAWGSAPRAAGDGKECDMPGCSHPPFYWRRATCGCEMNVCYAHRALQARAGAFWCAPHERRAQWFQERYLR